jgi:hypothetical protein
LGPAGVTGLNLKDALRKGYMHFIRHFEQIVTMGGHLPANVIRISVYGNGVIVILSYPKSSVSQFY